MKILTRYIIKEALGFFLISLFAFTSILVTLRIVHFTSLIINKGVGLGQIGIVFLSIVPMFLEIAIPMATLLGVMLAFARLSGDSEIIIVRASGISLNQLLTPIVFFGLVTALATFYVCVSLAPFGQEVMSRTLFEIAKAKTTAGINEGVFNKLGNIMLYTEGIDNATGELSNVLVDDKREKETRKIVIAKRGRILSNEETRTITLVLDDGYIHEVVTGKYVTTRFDTNNLVVPAEEMYGPDGRKDRKTSEMLMGELSRNISEYGRILEMREAGELPAPMPTPTAALEDTTAPPEGAAARSASPSPPPAGPELLTTKEVLKKYHRMKVERARRFSMPFAAFFLALMAVPLGIQPPRTQRAWGVTLSVSLGLLVFVVYYGLLSVGTALAESGLINASIAVWIPNFAAAAAAYYCIQQVASERWQSIAHGFEEILMKVAARLRPSRAHENPA